MKKLLLIPVLVGLAAVPSIASAQRHNSQDSTAHHTASVNESSDDTLENEIHNTTTTEQQLSDSHDANDDNPGAQHSSDSDDDQQTTTAPSGAITIDEAKTIAQNVYPDKTIKKVELENEHGTVVYSVRFTDSSRVDVSAADGSVVRSEMEADQEKEESESGSDSSGHSNDD